MWVLARSGLALKTVGQRIARWVLATVTKAIAGTQAARCTSSRGIASPAFQTPRATLRASAIRVVLPEASASRACACASGATRPRLKRMVSRTIASRMVMTLASSPTLVLAARTLVELAAISAAAPRAMPNVPMANAFALLVSVPWMAHARPKDHCRLLQALTPPTAR